MQNNAKSVRSSVCDDNIKFIITINIGNFYIL